MMILSVYPLPGISYAHDANACLVNDDGILFASEEERHLRSLHAIGHYPERAAMSAFRQTGVAPDDIDFLVATSLDTCRRSPDYRSRLRFVQEQLQIGPRTRTLCVPHHLAHSALAVLTSPFDDCLFVTLDGGGDGHMGHWGEFRSGRFHIRETFDLSPGIFFSFVTSLCGLRLFEEGKTMGLAAYGEVDQRLLDWFRQNFGLTAGGVGLETTLRMAWSSTLDRVRINPDTFPRHKYHRWALNFTDGQERRWIDEIPPEHIARTGQAMFEELMDGVMETLMRKSGLRQIACAGGAFLNVRANGVLGRRHPDASFHLPGAPHDAGLSLGAALWTRHIHGRARPSKPTTPFLGAAFSRSEVEQAFAEYGLDVDEPADLAEAIARAVADGQVVGWFDGPAEYGARALGARSVLADPRRPDAKARLNQLLKHRDWFMPYAPSVLEEYADEFLEDFRPSPYMNIAFAVRKAKTALIPAAVHADGSCRAHAISRRLQPRYYAVIEAFHRLTGLPVVLNTSFNRHGVPMVSTPRQAVQHLLEGCVDLLAIDGFVARGADRRRPPVTLAPENRLLALMSLRRAALLARDGRLESARALAGRAGTAVSIDESGIRLAGQPLWRLDEPLERLDGRWLDGAVDQK